MTALIYFRIIALVVPVPVVVGTLRLVARYYYYFPSAFRNIVVVLVVEASEVLSLIVVERGDDFNGESNHAIVSLSGSTSSPTTHFIVLSLTLVTCKQTAALISDFSVD